MNWFDEIYNKYINNDYEAIKNFILSRRVKQLRKLFKQANLEQFRNKLDAVRIVLNACAVRYAIMQPVRYKKHLTK